MSRFGAVLVLLVHAAFLIPCSATASETAIDFGRAVIVAPADLSGPEKKAVAMLTGEVEKRTQIRWRQVETWPAGDVPAIAVGQEKALRRLFDGTGRKFTAPSATAEPEGYQIQVDQSQGAPIIWVAGNDPRGVLFGVGHLLRNLRMDKRDIKLPERFKVRSAPHYPVRGHQLGYRPKTNSFDGWTLAIWEQYIRDLVVFGTNAVELIPPRSDDDADSPHFPLPPMEMMVGMSKLCADYGLDVWIWYPAMDRDYSDPKTVAFALEEWGEVFRQLPRIDAVFVPGGDPGHTAPRHLMALLEKETEVLHRYHPRATMWVSPQSFHKTWMDEFLDILKTEPAWLTGIVYGPQMRLTLPQLRAAVPKKYPIRHYPDITHSRQCQYPVPDWDMAFALTEAREVINPRPLGQAHIFRLLQKDTNGFITYSEGCNDDVNKIVWSALGWNPEAEIVDILRDYSRYFLGPKYTDSFAQGLLALEKNWEGSALTNANIYTTLQQFQALEKAAGPRDRLNWRFQQALYRAYYDAYVRSRLLYETQLEDEALAHLRQAKRSGALLAVAAAEKILDRAATQPVSADWRARVFELAEALFQSIRMQLSVERYQAISVGRGANLDTIDRPLNNRAWLLARFAAIRRADSEAERLKQIDELVNWTNPGPGGFYDDLGNPACQPHLVRGPGFAKDPAFFKSALTHFDGRPQDRKSWWDQALALYDAPLHMRYEDLDGAARYKVRVVYGGGPIRLVANEKLEIHPPLTKTYQPLEFNIPPEATADGVLNLHWYGQAERGGAGRGCQVAEIWLVRR
ncbi:MAG TPA: hypothetical protein VNX28_05250 [Gemmataceae bacterium]|jgi:hypothetical protein|nr:hypothetical protein [Gemmataceae bacterium]